MAYEYLYERVERLKEKPFDAAEVMKMLNKADIYPLHLRVDNTTGQIIVYFERSLDKREKEALDEFFKKLFIGW